MRSLNSALLANALLLLASPALAQRTDELVLLNGNTITGEVKSLQQGKLRYKTDDVDTIYVKWEAVQSLTSTNFFEVENVRGEFFYGMLAPGKESRELAVLGPTGHGCGPSSTHPFDASSFKTSPPTFPFMTATTVIRLERKLRPNTIMG